MNELVLAVEASIQSKRLLRRGQAALVAVSGGLDSMVLLQVLHGLARVHGWKLVVAHFNHRLRGPSSDADDRLVRSAAKRLMLPCVGGGAEVRSFARAKKMSVEMAARQLRHEFLARLARARGIRVVALAHHADDQVELFFLRLLRGAGAEGLAGMKWIGPSPAGARLSVIRPLLDQPKTVLRAFAREQAIPFREDASNASLDIQRNRIRHELLPLLVGKYQPALTTVILRQMELLGAEADFSSQAAREWLRCEPRPRFDELPPAVQRRCLQLQLFKLGLSPDFDLIAQLRLAPLRPVSVAPQQAVSRDDRGMVHCAATAPAPFDAASALVELVAPSGTAAFGQFNVRWRIVRQSTARLPPRARGCEWFDAGKVGTRIVLRHWCRGDRFQPIGRATAVKLQDLFTNAKIAPERRHRLVVATTEAGVVFWVEGLRMSECFKLDKDTARRLKWQWQRRP